MGINLFNSPKKLASQASNPEADYLDIGVEAGVKALLDAGITYDQVDQGIGCYVFGDSTYAQRVFYGLGMTGIPIFNVNNYYSSGSSGLWLGYQAIRSGDADCVLVIGFGKMYPDLSKTHLTNEDRNKPSPGWTPQLYANAQAEYLKRYGPQGAEKSDFAQITSINRSHGTKNPYSQLSKAVSAQDILNSPVISGDITRLQCCPSSTSAASAVLVSESFLATRPYLRKSAVEIAGQALATNSPLLFETNSAIELIGSNMTRQAAKKAYKQANIGARDISIIKLHDCFTTSEMYALEGLGLADEGQAWRLVQDGDITYGPDGSAGKDGKGWIVNPSGGLISKGHPWEQRDLLNMQN